MKILLILLLFVAHTYSIPQTFDLRAMDPQCFLITYDEGLCVSNWAIAILDALASTECVLNGLTTEPQYSTQNLIDCVSGINKCSGYSDLTLINSSLSYLQTTGVLNTIFYPSSSILTGQPNPTCVVPPTSSYNGNNVYYKTIGSSKYLTTPLQVQVAIGNGYSVIVVINMSLSLLQYRNGIYLDPPSDIPVVGYHAMKIVGWGTDSSNNLYWIAQNSWSNIFGQGGFINLGGNSTYYEAFIQVFPSSETTLAYDESIFDE